MATRRAIVAFGEGSTGPVAAEADRFGTKGAGLLRLVGLGLPVPAGIAVEVSDRRPLGRELDELLDAIDVAAGSLPSAGERLLAVRATSDVALPGLLDTVLNVGMTDALAASHETDPRQERWAWDCRRTLLHALGATAAGIHPFYLDEELAQVKHEAGLRNAPDTELDAALLREVSRRLQRLLNEKAPWLDTESPRAQLRSVASAMLAQAPSARVERELRRRGLQRLAVGLVAQQMVFGNRDLESGSGVAFTHDTSTGAPTPGLRFAPTAQGEPTSALALQSIDDAFPAPAFSAATAGSMDAALARLRGAAEPLRVEFIVESGALWFCQAAPARLAPAAQVRVAVEAASAGDDAGRAAALLRVDARKLDEMLHPSPVPTASDAVIATGLRASPGAASGRLCFSASDALARAARGEAVVLVRTETTPDDIAGMRVARAVITTRGGSTSHAAVIAAQMGLPCVVGCAAIRVDAQEQRLEVGRFRLGPGDEVTVNGSRGEVALGALALRQPEPSAWLTTLLGWADAIARRDVLANADRPAEIATARRLGARGLGLVRTEHMFLDGDRVDTMRRVILAPNAVARAAALALLEEQQEHDFAELLRATGDWPVSIRLLDPPLHEFLPSDHEDVTALGDALGVAQGELRRMIHRLQEANPMLGHRGCRIGITTPAIYDTQVRALLRAVQRTRGDVQLGRIEVLVPLVTDAGEAREVAGRIRRAARDQDVAIAVGAMIETPRACLLAGEIAVHVDSLSFGTNDLTQTTLGISRDDTSMFLPSYLASGLFPADPFVRLDRAVLELMELAVGRARAANPSLRIGICGEHAGNGPSLQAVAGLVDYVSCTPWRVPMARLALGQAAARTA